MKLLKNSRLEVSISLRESHSVYERVMSVFLSAVTLSLSLVGLALSFMQGRPFLASLNSIFLTLAMVNLVKQYKFFRGGDRKGYPLMEDYISEGESDVPEVEVEMAEMEKEEDI